MRNAYVYVWMVFLIWACIPSGLAYAQNNLTTDRPNFVLILVDDAAFMDFGAYGGEANTPTIDALASRGVMFTNYHTSPLCAPSRAMLLTGLDSHQTGVATISEILPLTQRGQAGYTMSLEPGVLTVADRLHDVGYRTYMTGKWHLGHGPENLPDRHGFDRSFVLDASGADNWEQKSYSPFYQSADWFEDGERATLPDDFYSSEFLVDQVIEYISEDSDSSAPFFAYLAFQAIHIPVQAPREFTDRYTEIYRQGWDELRLSRLQRAMDMGLVPEGANIAPTPEGLRAWTSLSDEEKDLYARSMAVNAGMLEAMDHYLSRLTAYLESTGAMANTIFLITSDNGPAPTHPVGEPGFGTWMNLNDYTRNVRDLGEPGSYAFIGPEWAFAASSPFDLFKFYASEGGMRVPLILSGPGIEQGSQISELSFVTDLAPTILELTNVDTGRAAFSGRSLLPALTGSESPVYGPDDVVGIEVSGNSALFREDWKLVRNMPPRGDGQWRLFDLETDPGETRELTSLYPDIAMEMLRDYERYAQENGVLELPDGYDIHRQMLINTLKRQIKFHAWYLVVMGLGVVLLVVMVMGLKRRIKSQ